MSRAFVYLLGAFLLAGGASAEASSCRGDVCEAKSDGPSDSRALLQMVSLKDEKNNVKLDEDEELREGLDDELDEGLDEELDVEDGQISATMVEASECSPKCQKRFVRCWKYQCGRGLNNTEAYDKCHRKLKKGKFPASCNSTCTVTETMESKLSAACPDGNDGNDPTDPPERPTDLPATTTTGANARECSAQCESEFDRCWNSHCRRGKSNSDAHAQCRVELTAGQGPLGSACSSTCTDTATMSSKISTACPGGNNGPTRAPSQPTNPPAPHPTDSPGHPTASPSQKPGGGGEVCGSEPAEKPPTPALCSSSNQGCCACAEHGAKTYVWWIGALQYCLHTYIPTGKAGPLPVVMGMRGYGKGNANLIKEFVEPADYYGFGAVVLSSILADGAGGFGLSFPSDGVVNDTNPTPCTAEDSRDYPYIEAAFKWIEEQHELNSMKIYTEGFSQNSMYALYVAVCFASRVVGVWQGGSGMAKTGYTPVTPGVQAQCSLTSYLEKQGSCCSDQFCTDCQYWPVYPRTCNNKIVDCLHAYTDDGIACGSDWYAYEAMVAEGNDARLLSFAGGKHSDPENKWAWKVGCLGIVDSCSEACAQAFGECADGASTTPFSTCEKQLKSGSLTGCTVGCAPTLAMLRISEDPVVSLSTGKFGTQANLPVEATKPVCKNAFGTFADVSYRRCTPPQSWVAPVSNPAACSG